MNDNNNLSRGQLRSRYRISGRLVLDTALHIGGGREPLASTDSPIVRDGAKRPFIPGSSLKGAFRAAVERMIPNLPGLRTCGLSDSPDACSTKLRARLKDSEHPAEQELLEILDMELCDSCKTFGSPHLASAVHFHDAPLLEETLTQVRDGVGIDRDSERAREGIKYDFEVVPPQVGFDFSLTLESPRPADLRLIALGLEEFRQGMVPIGGIRSRGLGRCHLEGLKVQCVDFTDPQALKAYLLEDGQMAEVPIDRFINDNLKALLEQKGA